MSWAPSEALYSLAAMIWASASSAPIFAPIFLCISSLSVAPYCSSSAWYWACSSSSRSRWALSW